jgi:hypothetical protein
MFALMKRDVRDIADIGGERKLLISRMHPHVGMRRLRGARVNEYESNKNLTS